MIELATFPLFALIKHHFARNDKLNFTFLARRFVSRTRFFAGVYLFTKLKKVDKDVVPEGKQNFPEVRTRI